jgi:predicted HAD superfamily Cof-like phosphohydrolase
MNERDSNPKPHSPIFNAIFDFNEQIIGLDQFLELNCLTEEQFQWTIKALEEEIQEFSVAYGAQDLIGMVDAVLDLVYFAVGTLKKMGLTRSQAYEVMMVIHGKNMTKKRGGKTTRGNFEEDAIKPEGFVSPEDEIGGILFGHSR